MDQRKKSTIVLCFILILGYNAYALMIPMYPPLAKEKGLDSYVIGYIFCLYPVGSVIGTSRLAQSMSGDQKKKVKIILLTNNSQ